MTFEGHGGTETFSCTVVSKRTLTSEGHGEITSLKSSEGTKLIPCEVEKRGSGCESGMKMEALHLPWSTELATVDGVLQDKIVAGVDGSTPEWELTCKTNEGYTNWCKVPSSITPYTVGGGIDEVTAASPSSVCWEGNLQMQGSERLTSTKGTVGISPATLPAWELGEEVLTATEEVKWEGKIKLTGNNETVECADTAEGFVGDVGKGEATKLTVSGCTGKFDGTACSTVTKPSIEALNAPWDSELSRVEGTIYDTLLSGGKGTPGLKMTCLVLGVKVVTECSGTIGLTVTNSGSHVAATFTGKEELACSEGTKGKLEGTQTITPTGGGELQVH